MADEPPAPVQTGRRDDPRVRVRLDARLVTVTRTQTIKLHNISRSGASITSETPLKRGADVVLEWRDVEAFAQVTWVEGCRCGLRFEEPIPEEAVLLARSLSDDAVTVAKAEERAAARHFARGDLKIGYGD